MSTVLLNVPQEIVDELEIPYDAGRDASAIVLAIEGINVAASAVTLASLRMHASRFVTAIRNWRHGDARASVTLSITGPGISLTVELPRNVSKAQLLDQLRPLLEAGEDH